MRIAASVSPPPSLRESNPGSGQKRLGRGGLPQGDGTVFYAFPVLATTGTSIFHGLAVLQVEVFAVFHDLPLLESHETCVFHGFPLLESHETCVFRGFPLLESHETRVFRGFPLLEGRPLTIRKSFPVLPAAETAGFGLPDRQILPGSAPGRQAPAPRGPPSRSG